MLPLQLLHAGAMEGTGAAVRVELDRRRAIAAAIELARPRDAVVVLGRGALPRIAVDRRGGWFPFDDRVVMRELLRACT
jgi:UDP-N-acetylmuramyl tripeptide synthase